MDRICVRVPNYAAADRWALSQADALLEAASAAIERRDWSWLLAEGGRRALLAVAGYGAAYAFAPTYYWPRSSGCRC